VHVAVEVVVEVTAVAVSSTATESSRSTTLTTATVITPVAATEAAGEIAVAIVAVGGAIQNPALFQLLQEFLVELQLLPQCFLRSAHSRCALCFYAHC